MNGVTGAQKAEYARLFRFGQRLARRWIRAGGDVSRLTQEHQEFLVEDKKEWFFRAGECKSSFTDDPFARGVMKEVEDAVQSAH